MADPSSLLSAGIQFAVTEAEAASAEPMLLKAGQFSLHHGMVVHASGANDTDAPRIGIALSYISARTRQRSAPDMHVTLVRGRDSEKFSRRHRRRPVRAMSRWLVRPPISPS